MIPTATQASPQQSNLSVMLASTTEEIEQAMRLRYRVFVEEEKNMRMLNDTGLERDEYDGYCDHLIVKDMDSGCVVGTYRLLPGERAGAGIGFYSETEFDLSAFGEHKRQSLELGRSCVDPAYRGGRAIQLLWEGIAGYMAEREFRYLIGCASMRIPSLDNLNAMFSMLKTKRVITERFGIRPLETHAIAGLRHIPCELPEKEWFRKLPPLMKGYQWLGAEIAGDPAYDALFDTVDFFIVLEKERVTRRYKKHFLKERQ
ncbi:GNAT family N-acetyltransferase [Paenibacillus doosanensis]|uniref:GNAT family N-acetyltransferase n=1 Tax=Paenibacillus doosanensis TaxID=1229154 RepID=UPI00217F869C|nr:GNAT family N-acyltransferase [Paenibacillus doosanensis]MCS7461150.1 GNAT family N-acetyltransferase [Paenibacillus doosanensis]